MGPLQVFVWGFAGSVAVEVLNLYQVYHLPRIEFPERYRRTGFYIVRFFVALIAGGLAIAYEIQKPLLAANVGAATPLIMQALAKGLQSTRVK